MKTEHNYDNDRGWKNYDWIESQTERTLTSVVWAITVLGAMVIVFTTVFTYEESVITAIIKALY